ncbi:hypothetical protein [Shimia sp.]|uniref:hypothetical protein n=1 Tax=Shimia sp. TaxID=1954381 RepID=UPI003297804A
MFRPIFLACILAIFSSHSVVAQSNQRTQFNEGLARFNEMIMSGELGAAVAFLRPELELGDEEIAKINERLGSLYSDDFVGSDTVRSETLKGGFRQELLAYWTAKGEYFFVYLLLHSRDNQRDVLSIQYDTDFHKLMGLF